MREQIYVTPAPGMKVRHPDTKKYIKDEGEYVERSSFWIRRQIAGEVFIGEPKAITVNATPETAEAEAAAETAESVSTARKKKTTKKGDE